MVIKDFTISILLLYITIFGIVGTVHHEKVPLDEERKYFFFFDIIFGFILFFSEINSNGTPLPKVIHSINHGRTRLARSSSHVSYYYYLLYLLLILVTQIAS